MQKRVFIRLFNCSESRYIEYCGIYDDEKYTVDFRYWFKDNGVLIREWLPDEYLKCDPNRPKTIHYLDRDENTVCAECHCVEFRSYTVKCDSSKYPRHTLSREFDYQKQEFFDTPKNNRYWATPEEYDGWEHGIIKELKRCDNTTVE